MKKKKIIKLLCSIFIFIAAFTLITAKAENTGGFKIKRVVSGVTNHVDNTFSYTVENVSTNPAVATNLPKDLYVHVDADPDKNDTVTEYGIIPGSMWQAIKYPKVGTYKFIVKETASTDSTTYPVDDREYYVYIQVNNKVDSANNPTGEYEVIYIGSKENDEGSKKIPSNENSMESSGNNSNSTSQNNSKSHSSSSSNKDTVYDNLFSTKAVFTNISITNNLKSKINNKRYYNKYKVEVYGPAGDKYVVSGQDKYVNYKGKKIKTKKVYKVGKKFYLYLKTGQTATIGYTADNRDLNQIKIGTRYKVTVIGKKSKIDGEDGNSISKTASSDADKNMTVYSNPKPGIIDQEVFLSIIPFIVLLILSMIGIYMIRKTDKKEESL